MRTRLRTLLAAVAIGMFALAVHAQQYTAITLVDNAFVNATKTSNYTAYATLTKYDEAAVEVKLKLSGAGTDDITYTFDFSGDASNWTTRTNLSWVIPANGTTQVLHILNIDVGSIGYLRCKSIANAAAGETLTNTVTVYVKPRRSG